MPCRAKPKKIALVLCLKLLLPLSRFYYVTNKGIDITFKKKKAKLCFIAVAIWMETKQSCQN